MESNYDIKDIQPTVPGVADKELAQYREFEFENFSYDFGNVYTNQNGDVDSIASDQFDDLEISNFTKVTNNNNQPGFLQNLCATSASIGIYNMPSTGISQKPLQDTPYPSPTSSQCSSVACDSNASNNVNNSNEKLSRKRARNCKSAKRSREKRKKYEDDLGAEEMEQERENEQWKTDKTAIRSSIESLRACLPPEICEIAKEIFSDSETSARLSAKEILQQVMLKSNMSVPEILSMFCKLEKTSGKDG